MTTQDTFKIGPLTVRPFIRNGKATGQWQLDLRVSFIPKHQQGRPLFPDRKAAEAEAKRLLREMQLTGRIAGHGPAPAGVTFSELVTLWLKEQADRVSTLKKRAVSLETNAFHLKAAVAFLGSDDIQTITDDRMVAYQKHRLALGRKPPTINSEVATTLQVLRWGHRKRLLDRLPEVETIPVSRKRLDLPRPEEIARVVAALPQVEGVLIRFLAETGCRKAEAFHLEWTDVDELRGVIRIQAKEGFTPKTQHSERPIHVSAGLLAALRALPKTSKLVFPGKGDVVRTSVKKALATAVRKAEVTRDGKPMKITLHMLRKAHATWQAMSGVDANVLQARLGHAPGSRVTQKIYVQATDEAMRKAVLELPSLGGRDAL